MADAKAVLTQRFDAARAALANGDELGAAESLHSAVVAARSDPSLRRELVTALYHLGKLSRKFGRAGEAEAEQLLTEALTISEELVGREHAALVPLLSELSRLHVQRSQHARAGDVLERLLAIARAKGDETADVASALAGLALVKRKLDDDTAAEGLYRDALRIREKVLGPDHMATIVTLEHLSETCAARGNLDEALSLLRRALAAREVSLGPGHASVQAAKSRVAELELQIAVAADTAAAAAAKATRDRMGTPAWLKRVPASRADAPSTTAPPPSNSKNQDSLDEPEPRVPRPAALPRERAKTPAVTAVVAAASLMATSIRMPSASQIVISPPPLESARPSGSVARQESGVPQPDAIVTDPARDEVAAADVAVGDWQSEIASGQADLPQPARKKRAALYAPVGVAVFAIAGLLMARPRADHAKDRVSTGKTAAQPITANGAPVVTAALTRTGYPATGAASARVGATGADSLHAAGAAPAPTAPSTQVGQPDKAAESTSPELHVPRVAVHLRPINIPSVQVPSISVAPSVDSAVPGASERRASDYGRSGTGDKAANAAPADAENAVIPAKIIGRPPAPRFPDALLRSNRRDGQVVVRFIVNELGQVDVATMIVERSDHELFTAAVRDILPLLHFEPARTRAPESKPVASWVSIPFRFTTTK